MDSKYQQQFMILKIAIVVSLLGCIIGGAVIGHYLATVLEASP